MNDGGRFKFIYVCLSHSSTYYNGLRDICLSFACNTENISLRSVIFGSENKYFTFLGLKEPFLGNDDFSKRVIATLSNVYLCTSKT